MCLIKFVAAKVYLFYLRHDKKTAKGMTILAMLAIYLFYTGVIIVLLSDYFPQIDYLMSNQFLYFLHFVLMLAITYLLHKNTWKSYQKILAEYEQKHKYAQYHVWIFFVLPFVVFALKLMTISLE
jgi:SNF family Na+-dependent transporter